jgi:hypothetical protein
MDIFERFVHRVLAHREYLNAFVRECYRTRANPWCVYHPGVGFSRIHVFTECYRTVSLEKSIF